jgi:glycosyltransferase involved in cell wall biosynthesis
MQQMILHDSRTEESMETVAVVIPTLNEERSISAVIEDVPVNDLRKNGFKTAVYVIDGRSVDHTRDIAVQKGAQIVTEQRRGKGVALQTAFRTVDADYVIVVDGDNTYPISVATEMLRLLQTYDVVIGSRLKGTIEPGAMTRLNTVGNKLLTFVARALFNVNITDVCTGLWGFRDDAIRRLELEAQGFEIEADMYSECARKGLSIAEIPIHYRARADHAKLAALKDGLRIGAFLCRKWRVSWTTNPSASSRPERAATPDSRQAALVQRMGVNNRQQKWIQSSEFSDERWSDQNHWIEGNLKVK